MLATRLNIWILVAGDESPRFKVVTVAHEKGSVAGYVAKYVSKNIDGAAVGDDEEAVKGIYGEAIEEIKGLWSWWGTASIITLPLRIAYL